MEPLPILPLFDAVGATRALAPVEIFYSLCLSFVLGMVVATVYRWTHSGFSYARSFLHTIVLAAIVITIMIMAIGNNMARGLGILGAMAFIRFRTPIRDPRDIIFLFSALAIGISSGAQVYLVAIIGTLFFSTAAIFLAHSPFASRREFEGLLRFMLPKGTPAANQLPEIFDRFCSNADMVAMRDAIQGEVDEFSYQVRLLDPSYKTDLIDAVAKLEGVSEVSLVMNRTTVEI
ncbi:hypothetical protein BH23VER1_BH23VER1_18670 [soil metagenome]